MVIDLCCERCDGSFELDAIDLLQGESSIHCSNCDARLAQSVSEDLGNALAELCRQLAAVRKKFSISLSIESDDLPPPYDKEDDLDEDEDEESEDDLEEYEDDEDEDEDDPL